MLREKQSSDCWADFFEPDYDLGICKMAAKILLMNLGGTFWVLGRKMCYLVLCDDQIMICFFVW